VHPSKSAIDTAVAISADTLFAPNDETPADVPMQMNVAEKRLHFSVWSEVTSRSSQLTVSGIVQEANRLGNHVSLHSLMGIDKSPAALANLAERLRNDPCDGYLILEPWGEWIEAAIGHVDKPAVYFWGITSPGSNRTPLVVIDVFNFYFESVRRLQEQGYKRIAGISLQSQPVSFMEMSTSLYEGALRACGLKYSRVEYAALNVAGSFGDGPERVVRRLLDVPADEAPDAIIVSDDHLTVGVARAVEEHGRKVGQDFGIISWANKGMPVGEGDTFSLMENDLEAFGGIALELLARNVRTAGPISPTIAIAPRWKPGTTHLRK
jgi:DNA-binding LacI/PurR family transcriptional regulator